MTSAISSIHSMPVGYPMQTTSGSARSANERHRRHLVTAVVSCELPPRTKTPSPPTKRPGLEALTKVPDDLNRPTQGRKPHFKTVPGRVQPDRVDAGIAPHPQPFPDHSFGSDQRRGQDHL